MALRLSIVRTIISFGLIAAFTASGQDIPMFSQKLTNSFLYNLLLQGTIWVHSPSRTATIIQACTQK